MFTIIGARCGCRRCQSWPEVPAKLFIACGGPSELFDPVTVKTGVHAGPFPEGLRKVAPGSGPRAQPATPLTSRRLSSGTHPGGSRLAPKKVPGALPLGATQSRPRHAEFAAIGVVVSDDPDGEEPGKQPLHQSLGASLPSSWLASPTLWPGNPQRVHGDVALRPLTLLCPSKPRLLANSVP